MTRVCAGVRISPGLVFALALCTGWGACTSEKSTTTEKPAEPRVGRSADTASQPSPEAEAGAAEETGLEAAKARCRAALRADRPDAEIELALVEGPAGVIFVRARDPEAYPGTGVAALVYDPATETTHGKRGEHGLSVLLQRRGWLERGLPDADLVRLVHEAHFDGVLILKDPMVEARDDGGLRVVLPAHTMRGELHRTWIVDIPARGEERVGQTP